MEKVGKASGDYNFPVSSITVSMSKERKLTILYLLQTFVYLFAPICHNIRETDFDQVIITSEMRVTLFKFFNKNMRLQNGKKIWSALWEYRHPDLECFTAQVCQNFS